MRFNYSHATNKKQYKRARPAITGDMAGRARLRFCLATIDIRKEAAPGYRDVQLKKCTNKS